MCLKHSKQTLHKTMLRDIRLLLIDWGIKSVISSLKSGKIPGRGGLSTEIFKCIPRDERICGFCILMHAINMEFHILLACPAYCNIRRKYLSANCYKLNTWMQSTSKQHNKNITLYIHAFCKRQNNWIKMIIYIPCIVLTLLLHLC